MSEKQKDTRAELKGNRNHDLLFEFLYSYGKPSDWNDGLLFQCLFSHLQTSLERLDW